jgi:hypothetical protein
MDEEGFSFLTSRVDKVGASYSVETRAGHAFLALAIHLRESLTIEGGAERTVRRFSCLTLHRPTELFNLGAEARIR